MQMLKLHKPRPHVWRVAKDPETRLQYYNWMQARTQAVYRGAEWELTFRQWQNVWRDSWHLRGRDSDSLCITRIDRTKPWRRNNVELITRLELRRRSNQTRWDLARK